MKKTFNNIKLGIIKGWTTPNLPDHIVKLQLHPLIRIFRVISGISILLILTKRINYLSEFFLYFSVFFSILFFFYHCYISFHRIKHIYRLIKNGDLDVKNSPINRIASLASRLISCAKGACETAAPVGVTLGIMAGFDTMLEHKGRSPIFLPFLADVLIPDSPQEKIYKERKRLFSDANKIDREFKFLLEEKETIKTLENSKLFSKEDIEMMNNTWDNEQQKLVDNKE